MGKSTARQAEQEWLQVVVSQDQLTALLHCPDRHPLNDSIRIAAEIRRLLATEGILHGIDPRAIQRAALTIAGTGCLRTPVAVAVAEEPRSADSGPAVHVETRTVTLNPPGSGDSGQAIRFTLAPIVRAGKVLVSNITNTPPEPPRTVYDTPLPVDAAGIEDIDAGRHVALSEDGRLLRATVAGYPELTTTRRNRRKTLTVGITPLVEVSEDQLHATLHLRPRFPGSDPITVQLLLSLIAEAGIVYGVKRQALERCIGHIEAQGTPITARVAEGLRPDHGRDAYLRFAVEVGPFPGRLLDRGRIDFRERKMFLGIDQDQLIATRIPPTAGTPGRNVFGNDLPQRAGRDIRIRVSDDATFDRTSGEVRAAKAGVLSMVSANSVRVCSCQRIPGNVDYATGNIVSRAALEIDGSIRPGFQVHALGDILVSGNVENASLRSDSNVVIRGGITGESCELQVRGDADLKFIEHGFIAAGACIVIRNSAYHSRLHCSGPIRCDPLSRVVSCRLIAGGSISGGSFGGEAAAPSILAAGVDPERWEQYQALQQEISDRENVLDTLRIRHGSRSSPERIDRLVAEIEERRNAVDRLSLLPAAGAAKGLPPPAAPPGCEILVHGKIYAGTVIRIGNASMTLSRNLQHIRFHPRRTTETSSTGEITLSALNN